jgi:uncharacterized OB-fold protein
MPQASPRPPLPIPQPEAERYWRGLREREIWLRGCNTCGATYFYPRDICPACFSRDTTWRRSSGRGTLYAFAIVHRPPAPAFRERVPYVVGLVQLEGSARIPANIVDVAPDPAHVRIGMALEPVFEDQSSEITLLKFRPTS